MTNTKKNFGRYKVSSQPSLEVLETEQPAGRQIVNPLPNQITEQTPMETENVKPPPVKLSRSTVSSVVASINPVPRSVPVSGRIWKIVQSKPNRDVLLSGNDSLRSTPALKQTKRVQLQRLKARQKSLDDAIEAERADRKRGAEQRKKQKEENTKKSQVVQKINNTAKIKKMSRKQLKSIEKA